MQRLWRNRVGHVARERRGEADERLPDVHDQASIRDQRTTIKLRPRRIPATLGRPISQWTEREIADESHEQGDYRADFSRAARLLKKRACSRILPLPAGTAVPDEHKEENRRGLSGVAQCAPGPKQGRNAPDSLDDDGKWY